MAAYSAPNIQSFVKVEPMIYAYDTPGVTYHDGWIKIGYTDKQTPEQRIKQQGGTIDIMTRLLWKGFARYTDNSGDSFKDSDFHAFLEFDKGIERKDGEQKKKEWFHIDKSTSRDYFDEFAARGTMDQHEQKLSYTLRDEQEEAVRITKAYFEGGGTEFLWNAKPRFGKTLTAYDLVRRMGLSKVLIVTNRPSIANSWAEDFRKFVEWRGELSFVSDTDALAGKPGVLSRKEYMSRISSEDKGMVAFVSLQDLKGSIYFGGNYPKLEWMAKEYQDNQFKVHHGLTFDMLIIDEAQEGVETLRTERAFNNIDRKYTLYLSGTPFKQLASAKFSASQIYNWSYSDEQERKESWIGDDYNPYEPLPRLAMYTYQLSSMIRERIGHADLDAEEYSDYAFDLNEFFATNEAGRFIHEADIKKFLHALSTQEKYPFSTPKLRKELSHTLWYMNRIQSVEALEKLLAADPVFSEYHVVKVVGDGSSNEDTDAAAKKNFDRVKKAIATYDKTITLTVGQLTVGVTVPEWSGVLMLCNLKSPSSYMQAAFRAQNPCMLTVNGETFQKETAYVFDFDPARTLIIFDDFANNLNADTVNGHGTSEERKENIRRLLNFFPILGEDDEGRMIELDAAQVLSIPRKLKCQEVVRSGFMCNYLFNIGNVFGAPAAIQAIVEKLQTAHEDKHKDNKEALDNMSNIHVGADGEVEVPEAIVIGQAQNYFAEKKYEDTAVIQDQAGNLLNASPANSGNSFVIGDNLKKIAESVKKAVKDCVTPVIEDYNPKKSAKNRIETEVDREIDHTFQKLADDYKQEESIAQAELNHQLQHAQTEKQASDAEQAFQNRMKNLLEATVAAAQEEIKQTMDKKPQEVIEHLEKNKAESAKRDAEEEIRAHLRGFSRTIPSFIMAYGDDGLTLANFDDYTEDDVFLEVTGITEEDFRFLRDGGDRVNPETGETEHWDGHLFDETVFNDSIREFLRKKQELADYFDETHTEDIFDYIPPQKTNQIFTPKRVVKMMVDELENQNPGCFDDPTKTYADLYMKSGLYITEIVKRLYNSPAMKTAIPDDRARIRHVLQKQVYGMAPTRIIYLIATNYILGFDETLKEETNNFVEADAAEASKNGTLAELVDKYFG
ncbi:MAG: DEAD/DEAH box helicase family protein [Lachnospiraceae bacterium]|nr:DEAD/DEAH box helicase family protein [Lachnospiraceae bacterium]